MHPVAGNTVEYHDRRENSIVELLRGGKGSLTGVSLGYVISALAVALSIYHLYIAYAGAVEAHAFRSTHLAFVMVLCFLTRPLRRKSWSEPVNIWFFVDLILIMLVVAVQVYTLWDLDAFILRRGDLTDWDLIMGTVMIFLLLEATRRAVGWAMVIIALFFLVQTVFSDHFFGVFYGPPNSWFNVVDYLFMRENGIYGIPLMVMATYIFLFILFGALLVRSGAGRFFINVALALTGRTVGGPAKASIVSSCLMASISGSAVANVVTTGSFTIPLMERIGYRPYFAAAVEACASSGGQIMPPVMGAAAFIIAEFLNMPYLKVAVASLFPALIYFFSIFVMVHFEARKRNLPTLKEDELPDLKYELKRGGHLFISILVIILLLVFGYTPMFSAFWAIVSIFVLSFLRRETRMTPLDIVSALEEGARAAVPVSVACAAAGIIIGCVFVSGLGLKFTNALVTIAGGKLWVTLILTMFASLILGMGLTTTAVYITLAALVVPAVVKMGVEPIAAHLFAFYFGLVSAITPPVALASFAAAGVAKANPMQTGFHSVRLGIAKYILPFVFVYNPGLVMVGKWYNIVLSIIGGFLGIYALTITTEGWAFTRAGLLSRLLACLAAFLYFVPYLDLGGLRLPLWGTQILGTVILAAVLFANYARLRKVERLTEEPA
ncbi:TRAP transporter permease [Thermodesulforhabdus norvegica]|uniref:TRAP transporter, 4TM/12TM fusion protein n=1 Tax=Thermodesulforhabdus norvegica TaxID=39841 RepID=A0A1I4R274_9BACT|nr:TRAP transporter permease [Thermodesulforhabdus norvegica]SFM46357.1 TRAP transporter, 4TM/12TM fusion protein [Thermodesulforhabdus norvegica]